MTRTLQEGKQDSAVVLDVLSLHAPGQSGGPRTSPAPLQNIVALHPVGHEVKGRSGYNAARDRVSFSESQGDMSCGARRTSGTGAVRSRCSCSHDWALWTKLAARARCGAGDGTSPMTLPKSYRMHACMAAKPISGAPQWV